MMGNIILNQDRVSFEEPYGVVFKSTSGELVRISDSNWINSLILFFVYSNVKKNINTTVGDVVDYFDKSRIFYLQKNPVPTKSDVHEAVQKLLQRLVEYECIMIESDC